MANPDREYVRAIEDSLRRYRDVLEMIGGFYTTEETEQSADPRATALALDTAIEASRAALRQKETVS